MVMVNTQRHMLLMIPINEAFAGHGPAARPFVLLPFLGTALSLVYGVSCVSMSSQQGCSRTVSVLSRAYIMLESCTLFMAARKTMMRAQHVSTDSCFRYDW